MNNYEANILQIPKIVELAKEFFSYSKNSVKPNWCRVEDIFNQAILDPNSILLYYNETFLLGTITEAWYSTERHAIELAWYGRKHSLGVLKQFIKWSKTKKVDKIILSHLNTNGSNDKKVAKLYTALGFTLQEFAWCKEV